MIHGRTKLSDMLTTPAPQATRINPRPQAPPAVNKIAAGAQTMPEPTSGTIENSPVTKPHNTGEGKSTIQ